MTLDPKRMAPIAATIAAHAEKIRELERGRDDIMVRLGEISAKLTTTEAGVAQIRIDLAKRIEPGAAPTCVVHEEQMGQLKRDLVAQRDAQAQLRLDTERRDMATNKKLDGIAQKAFWTMIAVLGWFASQLGSFVLDHAKQLAEPQHKNGAAQYGR